MTKEELIQQNNIEKQKGITLHFPKLELWQQEPFDEIKGSDGSGKTFVIKSKRQVGKTVLAICLLLQFALKKQCVCALIEPTQAQSKRVFKQIMNCLEGTKLVKHSNGTALTITLLNNSEIIFKSAEQRDRLRGFTVSGILIIDEAAFISDEIYQILTPWVDVHQATTLIISTPLFTDGFFYRLYSNGISGANGYKSWDWSKYDTSKYLPKEKLEQYKKDLSQNKFLSEYLGEFITEGSYVFGNVRGSIDERIPEEWTYLGIDWATGSEDGDYTVLCYLTSNGLVSKIKFLKGLSPSEQVDRICELIAQFPPKKIQVELNSIGRVYYDYLKKQSGRNDIIGFQTTNDSKRRIIEQLVKAFNNKVMKIPNNAELIRELEHYAVEKTTKGYTYNGVGGFHDDGVMALALAYDLIENNNGSYTIRKL